MMETNNKEFKLIDKAAKEFARKVLLPDREETDRYPFEKFSYATLKNALDVDFLHMNLSEDFGGTGRKVTSLCIVLQNLCEIDASMGNIIFTNSFSQEMLFQSGDTRLLKYISSTDDDVSNFLIAYPIFSHPDEIETMVTAKMHDGKYLVTGVAEQLVLGGIAKQCLIPIKISGQQHASLFYVNLENSGVQISDPVMNLGLHACPCADVILNCVEAVLVGKEEKLSHYFSKASRRLQICGAAMSAGIMTGAYKEALDYSQIRKQGGRKIIGWSEVQMTLADMAIKTNISKILLDHACRAVDAAAPRWEKDTSASAIYIQNAACHVTTSGIQLLGGSGYMKDYGQEKRFRDAKQLQALLGIAPLKKVNYLKTLLSR